MKLVRVILIAFVAYALIHTIPSARLDVVSGATKAKTTPAPAPAPAKPPAVYFFRIVTSDGTTSYEAWTDEQAKQKLAALTQEHTTAMKTLVDEKKEWDKTVPGEAFPVPAVPAPKITRVAAAPAADAARAADIEKLNNRAKTWSVIEVTDNGTTETSQVADETVGGLQNKLFEKYRAAVIAEKKRQKEQPNTPAAKVVRPQFKVVNQGMTEKNATDLVAKRKAAREKAQNPVTTTPAAAK